MWDEIPPGNTRLETLSLVASRLFAGYDVTVEAEESEGRKGGEPHVVFAERAPAGTRWKTALIPPELREPVSLWFGRDTRDMEEEVSLLLENLPIAALSWADAALRDRVGEIVERRLPGWAFSLLVRLEPETAILQLSFRSQQPMILAVTPSIFSSTLPVMFQSDLTAKLAPGLFPLIGTPVAWIARHRGDVETFARELLEDRNSVSNTRSEVEAVFVPDQISKIDALVNSDRFIFRIWVAAYSGIEGRYPELGVLAGWNAKREVGFDLEIYNEILVDVGEFGLIDRLGLRFRLPFLHRDLRAGAETEWPEREVWYRVWWDSERLRRPYAWWRYSSEYGHNAALGYRINEHIAIEIHYDGRYQDKIGLKGILLL